MAYTLEKFAARMQALVDSGYSKRKLAKLAGVDDKAVRNWIDGSTGPTLENVCELANNLSMQIGELLGESDENRDALLAVERDVDEMRERLANLSRRRGSG